MSCSILTQIMIYSVYLTRSSRYQRTYSRNHMKNASAESSKYMLFWVLEVPARSRGIQFKYSKDVSQTFFEASKAITSIPLETCFRFHRQHTSSHSSFLLALTKILPSILRPPSFWSLFSLNLLYISCPGQQCCVYKVLRLEEYFKALPISKRVDVEDEASMRTGQN